MSSVDTAELERIVVTVGREYDRLRGGRRRFRMGRLHRLAFLLLRVVAYSIPVALALLLLGIFFLGWGGSVQALLLLAWLVVSVLLLPLLILLNLPLLLAAWRQRRPIVKRGLLEPSIPSWQLKARWVVLGLTAVAVILAFTVEGFGWAGASLVLVAVAFPFLLLMLQSFLRLVQRNLDLLRSVEELREVLEQKLAEARRLSSPQVELPHRIAVELSETAGGFRRAARLRAIDESLHRETTAYSISRSVSYREGLRTLAPEVRLQLLEETQRLSENPSPADAELDEESGHWVWPRPELAVELVYQLDPDRRQVRVRAVRPAAADGENEVDGPA